jgi:ankyrin repeat protein
MDGKESEVQRKIEEYLRSNTKITGQEMVLGFKSEGKTLIHIAASSGHVGIVDIILNTCTIKSQVVNLADDRGFTPLMNATLSESDECMTALIKAGAKINSVTKDGASALHFAAADGSIERMRLLFEAGADVKQMSSSGTPLHWAAGKNAVHAVKYLITKRAPIETTAKKSLYGTIPVTPAILMAAVCRTDDGVCELIKAGAFVGHIISGNVTLLHVCAENNHINAVDLILKDSEGSKSAIVKSAHGNTPIELAAMHGGKKVVELLLPFSPEAGSTVEEVLDKGPGLLKEWEEKREKQEKEDSVFGTIVKETVPTHEVESIDPAVDEAAIVKAEEWKGKGNEAFKVGKYEEALAGYTEAIKCQGDNAILWSNRSATYLSLKKPRDALVDAEVCRGLRPDWDKACLRLAKARLACGLYEDAAVAAFEGLKLDNQNKTLKALTQQAVKMGKEAHLKEQEAKRNEIRRRKDELISSGQAVECGHCAGKGESCKQCDGKGFKLC